MQRTLTSGFDANKFDKYRYMQYDERRERMLKKQALDEEYEQRKRESFFENSRKLYEQAQAKAKAAAKERRR